MTAQHTERGGLVTAKVRSLLQTPLAALRGASYLRKWLILGAVIGVIAGLGAAVFVSVLELATHGLLGTLAAYVPPSPVGEGNAVGSLTFARAWAVPLVTGLGGLIAGIAVFGFAPEAEGHGTDAAIHAFHHNPKGIRARVSFIKIIASAITIGSGGSAGREGPTAQISASFASQLARVLDLTPADARIAVSVGIGAGIGAIFRAPLGGAVLGVDILYRDDVEVEGLVPSLVASIIAFSVFGIFEGFSPIFGHLRGYHFKHPSELVYYAALGIAAGLMGRLYARTFYAMAAFSSRMPGRPALKPAIGGVLVGLIGLLIPGVLGTGYGWIQRAMSEDLLSIPLWIVIALPFAKVLATALSIGTGGSGGIFGPGMVIGGFVGAAMWRLLTPLAPGLPADPAPFVVVGMISCFGSIAHAPLAVMLMVAEMTGTLALLPPAMIAVGVATLVVGEATIYRSQLATRADSPAHRFRFGMPLLRTVPAAEAMSPPSLSLHPSMSAAEALEALHASHRRIAPVVTAEGVFKGTVLRAALEELLAKDPQATLAQVTNNASATVPLDATLEDVLEAMATAEVSFIAVLEGSRLAGVVSTPDLLRGYRNALQASLRRLGGVTRGTILVEQSVAEGAPFAGKKVDGLELPPGTLLVSIQRGNQLLFPSPDTVLQDGDVVSVLARPRHVEMLRIAMGKTDEAPVPEAPPAGPDLV